MVKRRKSENNQDIRTLFSRSKRREDIMDKGGVSPKKMKIKTEDDSKSEEVRSHKFILKFKKSVRRYHVQYDHSQTVLQAIKSQRELDKNIKCDVKNIILQFGEEEKEAVCIATHFPCKELKNVKPKKEATTTTAATHSPGKKLNNEELVTLIEKNEVVEKRDRERDLERVDQDESYYLVYIKTTGGTRATTKKLLRSSLMRSFTLLCVYGTKDMTLKDAIDRDGRFAELGDFKLEDAKKVIVFSHDKIRQYHGQTFWICPDNTKNTDETDPQKTGEASSERAGESVNTSEAGPSAAGPSAAGEAGPSAAGPSAAGPSAAGPSAAGPSAAGEAGPSATGPAAARNSVATTEWVPVSVVLKRKEEAGESEDVEKIYKLLRDQFPKLREILQSRYPGKTFQKALEKVDFGKAQQAFSEVGKVKELFKLGDSVCKIIVGDTCVGTGFVLFNCYILTNFHLFKDVLYNNNIKPHIQITAMFHYDDGSQTDTIHFKVSNTFIDYDKTIDYAILELVVSEDNKRLVPPGLMKHCCPMPESGEACIIGHPHGDVKKFDPTCIIEKENRINEVNKHLQQYNNYMITVMSIYHEIKKQGIEKIWSPSDPVHKASTYNTFMLHGSSGSPVFDAHCGVFGMHTGGFVYGFRSKKHSVIEYAWPLLLILKTFVTNLKARNNINLLKEVEEELKENRYRMEILPPDEPMDES